MRNKTRLSKIFNLVYFNNWPKGLIFLEGLPTVNSANERFMIGFLMPPSASTLTKKLKSEDKTNRLLNPILKVNRRFKTSETACILRLFLLGSSGRVKS